MNAELLAILIARLDRLERLVARIYEHDDVSAEMNMLIVQLSDECRRYRIPDSDEHIGAARNMIDTTKSGM